MTVRYTEEQYADVQSRLRNACRQPDAPPDPPAHIKPIDSKAAAAGRASGKRERSTEAPDIEGALVVELQRAGLGGYERNYKFDPRRKLELDFAWVGARVAIEVQGGIHSRGAHVRPEGYRRDAEKSRRAQLMGWMVLPCLAADVKDKSIIADVETALELRRV